MIKKLVREWLGITDKRDSRYITSKEIRKVLATELKVILTESVTGEDTSKPGFCNIFPSATRDEMFGTLNSVTKYEARATAELYVNSLSSELLAKVNSEQFLDEIVKRINNKQVG